MKRTVKLILLLNLSNLRKRVDAGQCVKALKDLKAD
jgi:hypothetical protein